MKNETRSMKSQQLKYRIGIDVGENSVGLAAIEYDDDDKVIQILSCFSHIHDGGKLPGTDKAPQSRLAVAGVARRTRRLVRRRRQRLKALDTYLAKNGFVVEENFPQTYDAWFARHNLLTNYVKDEKDRVNQLSLAIRHIARHRGWRNPWWSYKHLQVSSEEAPSPSFLKMRDKFCDEHKLKPEDITTVGSLGYFGVSQKETNKRLRQSTAPEKKEAKHVFFERILEVDQYSELNQILEKQKVSENIKNEILFLVFAQKMPHVPKDRVGDDPLDKSQKRSSRAGLEFQSVRVLNAISNLRVREHGSQRELTKDEFDLAYEFLSNWKDLATPPTKSDVAIKLGIPTSSLNFPTWDQSMGSAAFLDDTSVKIQSKFKPTTPLGKWWTESSFEMKADFIDYLTDLDEEMDEKFENAEFLHLLQDDETLEVIGTLNLTVGRAAYSRKTYARLLEYMKKNRCNEHEARKQIFNLTDDWRPELPKLDEPMAQPVVDRVITIVRRFVLGCESKWGIPEVINIEHVRDAFLGPAALSALKYEIAAKTRKNLEVKERLSGQSSGKINKSDLRRERQIQRQNGVCLYCGTAITFAASQMDHIVPQADGGSNRLDNLVAVCKQCNQSKGAFPFVYWAKDNSREGVSLPEARARLKNWDKMEMSAKAFKRFQEEVSARLGLSEDPDGEIDERALASTAYAALEVRNRITSHFEESTKKQKLKMPKIHVFSGQINSMARKASGIDDIIQLRSKDTKDRFDRRHHAIDAALMTTLNTFVSQTLAIKIRMRNTAFSLNDASKQQWKEYEGKSEDHKYHYNHWRSTCQSLGTVLSEDIAKDRIPVMRSLRIQNTSGEGSVHDDTVRSLVNKPTESGLAPEEVRIIANPRARDKVMDSLEEDGSLSAENAKRLLGDSVNLFPGPSAQLYVRKGAVQIGNSVHHARVYAYNTKSGIKFGWVRVYAGEFAQIGFARKGVDILREPLPFSSQAMLTANPALVKKIASGEAKEIGWVTQDDELEFDPHLKITSEEEEKDGVFESFLRKFPERHWLLVGLSDSAKCKIYPAYLSTEGITDNIEGLVSDILYRKKYIQPYVNGLFSIPNIKIIRRSFLGVPRWKDSGLPYSWSPMEEAKKALGL